MSLSNYRDRSRMVVALLLGAMAAAACAGRGTDADDEPLARSDADGGDGSRTPPPDGADGSFDDGGVPVDAEADGADGRVPCSADGWCITPLPSSTTPTSLRSVWADDTGVAWAVSDEGNVFRWDGQSWTLARAGNDALYAIWGSGPTDLWITSATGILHGTGPSSSSLTWTLIPLSELPGDVDTVLEAVGGTSANDVWFAGSRQIASGSARYGVARVVRHRGLGGGGAPSFELESDLSTAELPPVGPNSFKWDKVLGTPTGELVIAGAEARSSGPYAQSVLRRVVEPSGETTWVEMFASFGASASCADYVVTTKRGVTLGMARANRVWLMSNFNGRSTGLAVGTFDSDSRATTWECSRMGTDQYLERSGLFATSATELWSVAAWGRINHYDGTNWRVSAVTATNLPITSDLYAISGAAGTIWAVGRDIALRNVRPL